MSLKEIWSEEILRTRKTQNGIVQILDLWAENKNSEIQCGDLLKKIMKLRQVGERQAIRDLQVLRIQKKVEPRKDSKNMFYKANQISLKEYLDSKKRNIQIGLLVQVALSQSVAEAKETTSLLTNQLWEEIDAKTKDLGDEDTSEAFDLAINHILSKKPTEEELKRFYSLYEALMKGCLQPLADPTVFSRLVTEDELPQIIEDQVVTLIEEFMTMWGFLYKHPGVVLELNEILTRNDPRRLKAKEQVYPKES